MEYERYTVLRGTNWRGDAYWIVYDNKHRISIGRRFDTEAAAEAHVAELDKRNDP